MVEVTLHRAQPGGQTDVYRVLLEPVDAVALGYAIQDVGLKMQSTHH